MNTLDELRALLSAADFGRLAFVQTDEDDGYIDDDNHEKPIAQALSVYHGLAFVAAVNSLPGLLAIRNAAKTALGCLDDPTGGDAINDMRRASDVLRAALAKDAAT